MFYRGKGFNIFVIAISLSALLCLQGCGNNTDDEKSSAEQKSSDSGNGEQQTAERWTKQRPTVYPSDLLWQQVDAGEWTIEEGLIANLRILAGETDASTVYGEDTPPLADSEVLIRTARAYMRSGKDRQARAEIKRLFDKLLIDTERLKEEAILDSSESRTRLTPPWWYRGLAALTPVAHGDTDCSAVWAGDWPQPDPDTGACVLKTRWRADGSTYQIHYPGQWRVPGHRELEYVERTRSILQTTLSRYRELGRMGNVDIFMGLSAAGEKAWAFPGRSPENACEIHVFQRAIARDHDPYYPFMIAHELFHCFQGLNMGRAYWGVTGGRGIRHHTFTAWWVEGAANYFADTVFPDAEYEIHRWSDKFDRRSPDTAIVDMAYESVFFFQFLGKRVDDEQIISWLRSLPGSGSSSAQATALADWGGMQTSLHEFGKAYLEQELTDANGDTIPFEPERGPVTIVNAPGLGVLAAPFVLQREQVKFAEGKGFMVNAVSGDSPPGRYAVKPQPEGVWRQFPPRIPSPCSAADDYQLLVTSAAGGGDSHQLDVELEELGGGDSEPARVDSCLNGRWQADPESLRKSMASMTGGVSGFRDVDVEADSWVCFDDAGYVEGYADIRAAWRFEIPGDPSHEMRSLVTIKGPFSGRYTIEDDTIELSQQANNVTADSQAWLNGEYVGEGGTVHMPDLPGRSRSTEDKPYRCSGDRLEWVPPVPGLRPEPVVYERVPSFSEGD